MPNFLQISQYLDEVICKDELLGSDYDGDGEEVHEFQPVLSGEDALPYPQNVEEGELLCEEQSHPTEAVKKRVNFQFLQSRPDSGFDDYQHFINFVELAVYSVFRFIQIFDVQLNNVCDGVVKHEKAGSLVDGSPNCATCIHNIENRGQYLVHALHILDARVQPSKNIQNPGHIVVAVSPPLHLLIGDKVFIVHLLFPVDQLKFLSAGASQVGHHDRRRR